MKRRLLLCVGLLFLLAAVTMIALATPRVNGEYIRILKERTERRESGLSFEHLKTDGVPKFDPIWKTLEFWPAVSLAAAGLGLIAASAAPSRESRASGTARKPVPRQNP